MVSRHLRTIYDQRVEATGLSGAKWSLIAAVAKCPGATQRSLAAMLDVTEVTAGRLVDRLCADGHLERRSDPKDRRAYRVYVTKAAKPLLKQLSQIATLCENEAFAGLSNDDVKKLQSTLDTMARNLSRTRTKLATKPRSRH